MVFGQGGLFTREGFILLMRLVLGSRVSWKEILVTDQSHTSSFYQPTHTHTHTHKLYTRGVGWGPDAHSKHQFQASSNTRSLPETVHLMLWSYAIAGSKSMAVYINWVGLKGFQQYFVGLKGFQQYFVGLKGFQQHSVGLKSFQFTLYHFTKRSLDKCPFSQIYLCACKSLVTWNRSE